MNENIRYITETATSGSDERVEVFTTLAEAMADAADFTRLGGYTTIVADVRVDDLADPDDWTSYCSYGYDVYAEYREGKPFFGFTPESIADDLASDTSFCFEDSTYYWHHNGETYIVKRDMSDMEDDFDTEDLYDTEVYDPYHSDPFTDCVDDIYEQAQRVEMIRAGLLDE